MSKKNKKLRHVISHSNYASQIVMQNHPELTVAKDIAKVNQVTDLLISIKNNEELLEYIKEAFTIVYSDVKNHSNRLFNEDEII